MFVIKTQTKSKRKLHFLTRKIIQKITRNTKKLQEKNPNTNNKNNSLYLQYTTQQTYVIKMTK